MYACTQADSVLILILRVDITRESEVKINVGLPY